MSRVTALFPAALLAIGLGCATDRHRDANHETMPMPMSASGPAGMNHVASGPAAMAPHDAAFIDGMIPHHQAAIDMSKDALEKGEHAEIRELAQRIITAQQAEIDQLKAWRETWYPALPATVGMAMPASHGLSTDPATPFDHRFIDAMIPHHEGALVMATRARTEAEHPEIKALAERILASQQAEIDQMKEWRTKWYSP